MGVDTDIIPRAVAAHIARLFDKFYSRTNFTNVFEMSGTSVESPGGAKIAEVTNWLLLIGRNEPKRALDILGKVLEDFFEVNAFVGGEDRDALARTMQAHGLLYSTGGRVNSAKTAGATATLRRLLENKNYPAVIEEFERATANVDTKPREAASAAANVLEALCKEYIVLHAHLNMPAKQDLSSVFEIVRKDLGLDPAVVQDNDLRTILSGLIAVVSGIAALRTHGSSAHAQNTSQKQYKLAPRHARLAVHSAHSIVTFILEAWSEREAN